MDSFSLIALFSFAVLFVALFFYIDRRCERRLQEAIDAVAGIEARLDLLRSDHTTLEHVLVSVTGAKDLRWTGPLATYSPHTLARTVADVSTRVDALDGGQIYARAATGDDRGSSLIPGSLGLAAGPLRPGLAGEIDMIARDLVTLVQTSTRPAPSTPPAPATLRPPPERLPHPPAMPAETDVSPTGDRSAGYLGEPMEAPRDDHEAKRAPIDDDATPDAPDSAPRTTVLGVGVDARERARPLPPRTEIERLEESLTGYRESIRARGTEATPEELVTIRQWERRLAVARGPVAPPSAPVSAALVARVDAAVEAEEAGTRVVDLTREEIDAALRAADPQQTLQARPGSPAAAAMQKALRAAGATPRSARDVTPETPTSSASRAARSRPTHPTLRSEGVTLPPSPRPEASPPASEPRAVPLERFAGLDAASLAIVDRMAEERGLTREAMLVILTRIGTDTEDARVDAVASRWNVPREEAIRVLGGIARSTGQNENDGGRRTPPR